MSHILIITASFDTHADIVCDELKKRGVNIFRLNTDKFLFQEGTMNISLETHGVTQTRFTLDNVSISCSDISRVWYRKPDSFDNAICNHARSEFAKGELQELFDGLCEMIPSHLWVSPLTNLRRAKLKILQLNEAKRLGFAIPRSCISNDPLTIRNFFTMVHGQVIYKTLYRPRIEEGVRVIGGIPTSIVSSAHLAHIELLRPSGGIFQEYIEKEFEVRVTIIGRHVFAVRIDSQSCDETRIDWRKGIIEGKISAFQHRLPSDIEARCRDMLSLFGLSFGAIDFVVNSKGEYIFLELNPNGQWYWVEHLTGFPMVATMADLLMS